MCPRRSRRSRDATLVESHMHEHPQLVIIAGPNGAGKSTIAPRVLVDAGHITEFVNADTIARGLSAFDPDRVAIQAGRIMLARLKELAAQRANFAFETTLSTRSFAPWLSELEREGYAIDLHYVFIKWPELSVQRVAQRVLQGGHHVPADVIHRRHLRSLMNLKELYLPLATSWSILDNSGELGPQLVAMGGKSQPTTVTDEQTWAWILSLGASDEKSE